VHNVKDMRIFTVSLFLLVGSLGAANRDPAQTLFDNALHMEQNGRLQKALLTLQTLVNTYSATPLAAQARTEIDAIELFKEGQQRVEAGKAGSAVVTFRTVAQVYPESPLAKQADIESRKAEKIESRETPVVRVVEFHGAWPVSMDDIRQRFTDEEIGVAVEQPYNARAVDRACNTLSQLLREKGEGDYQVKATTENVPPRSVRIVFTASPSAR
jgi:hypothetical protein